MYGLRFEETPQFCEPRPAFYKKDHHHNIDQKLECLLLGKPEPIIDILGQFGPPGISHTESALQMVNKTNMQPGT